jgi:hypothetical protein
MISTEQKKQDGFYQRQSWALHAPPPPARAGLAQGGELMFLKKRFSYEN